VTDAADSSPADRLAERKRQLVRDELANAALRLIAFKGFDETTVDQIVGAAGVSRRTFFRYFQSKEDVIVQYLAEVGGKVCATLAARPADEPLPVALRRAFAVFTNNEKHAGQPEKDIRLTKLLLGTPPLLARYLERQIQWREELTVELTRRAAVDATDDLRPALVAAVAFAAFDTALTHWAAGNGAEDLAELVDQAFTLVAGALDVS
jgi:AcrR family transcriptional regulator